MAKHRAKGNLMRRFLAKMSSASTRSTAVADTQSKKKATRNPAAEALGGKVLRQWRPSTAGPELLVTQGDLTRCAADAIVNAANTRLMHGGGLAGAIVRTGGASIQAESSKWVKDHGLLKVGDAVTTDAGNLPCQHVIHTVGPNVGSAKLTAEHAAQLRRAVWSALLEADRLEVASVAVPGISTGIFGYPRDLGAQEIVHESVRFCVEKGDTTKVERIALMNIDDPTVSSFVKAVDDAREQRGDAESEDEKISNQLSGLEIRE
ncbi:Hismacro and SEC14 domain-containing protein [Phytophthora cinnamomi]|uniref:Hismacro and SEC14 domain-containing protein n=1 Tax=Phytophthora cinnamomi TaxID=4785 RepID=UPI003559FC1E|nr:Hismacro and SEC14 domain-containing protein [Phytophthora cinnamomi]